MLAQRLFGLALFGSMLFGAGCIHGNYRVVKTVPSAGELALEGPQQEARTKAEGYMANRCPGGYDITEEGEAVIGQNSSSQSRKGTFVIVPTTETNTTTTDKREWRIKYQCKGGGAGTTTTTGAQSRAEEEIFVQF